MHSRRVVPRIYMVKKANNVEYVKVYISVKCFQYPFAFLTFLINLHRENATENDK